MDRHSSSQRDVFSQLHDWPLDTSLEHTHSSTGDVLSAAVSCCQVRVICTRCDVEKTEKKCTPGMIMESHISETVQGALLKQLPTTTLLLAIKFVC